MFLMIVVVAPIVEELLFRGMFLFKGDRLDTTWTRLLISAILFGLIHGPSDVYTAYTYIGMGLMFSYASKRTQSVESAIIYHFLNNLVGFPLPDGPSTIHIFPLKHVHPSYEIPLDKY